MSGKGSARRPKQISEAELDAQWRAWFPKPAEDALAVEMACSDCLFIPCLCPAVRPCGQAFCGALYGHACDCPKAGG